ncbi:MAG TPA: DUF3137 domain-containing protein [Hyphomonadaceae bacterium]|nr:DUF3137 domain-containing protein [Hyphomonadaceae bacterium]
MADRGQPELTLDQAMQGLPKDFAFFADRFRTSVQPRLLAREDDRVRAVKKQMNFIFWGVLAFIAISAAGYIFFQEFFIAIFGAFAGFGLYAWGSMDLNRLAKETKLMLIEPVSSEFGMQFQLAPAPPDAIHRCRALGLVPSWDRAKYEDQLTGMRGDVPFQFFEAHLEEKRTTTDGKGRTRTTWVTVFRGQCLAVRFHKEFHGITKVYRDMGAFNWLAKFGIKEPRVRLEDPEFEKAFEVYGSDQVEARFILTPDFMERLLGLERAFQGKQLRCAFAGGEMLLAVAGKNLLESGSMRRRMDDLNRVREILLDFAAIFLLIDAMSRKLTPDALRTPQA